MKSVSITQNIKAVFLALAIVLSIGVAQAWTGNTAVAPGNNTPEPVNVSTTEQGKAGANTSGVTLTLNRLPSSSSPALTSDGVVSFGQFKSFGKMIADLSGVSGNSADARDVLKLYAGNGATMANVVVNKNYIGFWDESSGKWATGRFKQTNSDGVVIGDDVYRTTSYTTTLPTLQTLDLGGTTNIGRGNSCTIGTSEECPIGTFLDRVTPTGNTCRYMNPDPAPHDIGACPGSTGTNGNVSGPSVTFLGSYCRGAANVGNLTFALTNTVTIPTSQTINGYFLSSGSQNFDGVIIDPNLNLPSGGAYSARLLRRVDGVQSSYQTIGVQSGVSGDRLRAFGDAIPATPPASFASATGLSYTLKVVDDTSGASLVNYSKTINIGFRSDGTLCAQ